MKKWFWLVGCDNVFPTPLVADQTDLDQDQEEGLGICAPVRDWSETAWLKATHDGEPDDALQTCLAAPVFSSRLRTALEGVPLGGVQYLPIRVIRPNETLITGYCIANVLNCADALDLRRSKVSRYPDDYFLPARRGLIRSLDTPVLVASVITSYDIIRLSTFLAPIYVSERFVKLFRDGSFTGYSFHEVPTSEEVVGHGVDRVNRN